MDEKLIGILAGVILSLTGLFVFIVKWLLSAITKKDEKIEALTQKSIDATVAHTEAVRENTVAQETRAKVEIEHFQQSTGLLIKLQSLIETDIDARKKQ